MSERQAPQPDSGAARDPRYRERLHVPVHWWLTPIFFLVVLAVGAEQYLGLVAAVLITAAAVALTVGFLIRFGGLEVVVEDAGLRVGSARLSVAALGTAHPLDASQARALRGPRADARARLFLRGYVPLAVRVNVLDPASIAPYWYVSTRNPRGLAAALNALGDPGPADPGAAPGSTPPGPRWQADGDVEHRER